MRPVLAIDDGQAFAPDFLLFLRERHAASAAILQLFIEPKGQHLMLLDDWKARFLKAIEGQARLETLLQGRHCTVYGLPFFNDTGSANTDFKTAFEGFLDPA